MNKNIFVPPPFTPPYTQAMVAKNITSPEGIFFP